MNKKFSTLVAGLLLAGAVGTANAQYSPLTTIGQPTNTVVANGAFQLGDGNGKVLALTRQLVAGAYEYKLKMVDAGNLAETLWKISYTENKEGGPSFTFVSAAYGIPLSFTAKNVKQNDIISDFPGNEAVWKWQPSLTKDNGTFGAASLINNYSAKLDSAIVLTTQGDQVVAKRYKTSTGSQVPELKLKPLSAKGTVLTADDLNSMMMTQKLGKFKLTFNGEPQNAENGNIWTSNLLKAVPAIANSTSMFSRAEGAVYYSQEEVDAVAAAIAAVNALNTAAAAKAQVEATTGVDDDFKALIAAVTEGDNYDLAKTAAIAEMERLLALDQQTIADKKKLYDAAQALKDIVGANNYGRAKNGVNILKTEIDALIDAVTLQIANTTVSAAEVDLVKGTIVYDATGTKFAEQSEIDNAINALNQIKTDLVAKTISGNITDANTAKLALQNAYGDVYTTYQTLFDAIATEWTGAPNTTGVNTRLERMAADIEAMCNEVIGATITLPVPAMNKDRYVESLANALTIPAGATYTQDDVDAVVAAITSSLAANSYITSLAECKTEAKRVADNDFTVPNATVQQSEIDAITAKLNTTAADAEYAVLEAIADVIDSQSGAQEMIDYVLDALTDQMTTISQAATAVQTKSISTQTVKHPGSGSDDNLLADVKKKYVSLSLEMKDAKERPLYLAVDTNFVTGAAGRRHLKFASWYYNADIQNSNEQPLSTANKELWRDYNGHFNFKFTYYPTQDSMVIVTDGYAMEPAAEAGVKNWVDIPLGKVRESYDYEGNGNTVMLAVLADNHSEVTVGKPQQVAGTNRETLNTRIGFNATVGQGAVIEAGVYTIQYVSENATKKNANGRYVVQNWLKSEGGNQQQQFMAMVEDQNLNHIPAAQWMLSHENGSNINTIVNRETGINLNYFQNNSYLPVQYLYSTATAGLYTTVYGDSLKLAKVDAEALKDSTLGYYAAAKYNEETNDQLNVYALKYLNNLASVFVNYTAADSILNVTAGDEAEVYFRLIPAAGAAKYGASNTALAKDLYRQAYRLQLETGKANVKDEDQLFVTVDANGKYRLDTRKKNADGSLSWIGETTSSAIRPFFLKEFKEGEDHSYALIEAYYDSNNKVWQMLQRKISVKDYPSILVTEDLEGENMPLGNWGGYYDGRTSTFMLTAKDAPKYRRLGVTDAEDGLKDNDTNYAKIYTTRNANRYLYENSLNKVAGYEEDPLGLNFLGDINTKEATKNLALFIDTAYVRNNTARPQYMIALRPDFTPDTVKCEAHPTTHPYDLVDAVHADYLVTLADSVKAYVKKTTQDKFKFDGYTRLAFVPAKHVGDEFTIANSIYTGTKDAAKDKKDLSKNGWNNGVWQFRLTGNDAEFYIEGAAENNFIRLVNGVAVVTTDIADAERFNIETTEEEATANEAVEAAEVSVVATQGAIIVKGAAGKVVTVANILGQTIANQVAASDNVTIAAPAGIAVVTVDGEATKVVVK